MKIGILGQGYVGSAMKVGFESLYPNLDTYDKYHIKKSTVSSLHELVENSDVIFICLPTPMKKNGECDISIVDNEIKKINLLCENKRRVIVIKSTVPPGTTHKMDNDYKNVSIVFNPEFLTELNFIEDFKSQNRIILGGSKEAVNIVEKIYNKIFPNVPIIKTESQTAEMVKYLTNIFLATKVAFANEMKIACDAIGVDYKKVIEYSLHDHRLGQSHWDVPGPDGKLGFGGSCFPKDINALIHFFDRHGLDNKLLKSVWETNLKVRPERDWEKLKGRAIVDED